MKTVEGELLLNDLLAVERKLERLNDEGRKGIIKDKGLHAQELALFTKLYEALSNDIPARQVELSQTEERALASYQLLTRKPMLVVFNVGDDDDPARATAVGGG
ncbi:MAG TPA: redox-regulated ATPase YchF, partial [Anaerolineales bacterium]|nr:redox-regulated ATPase YchF [Anaerolineales bacterium]